MNLLDPILLFVAGLVAGAINGVAGGGTLLSFPTLVWLGRDPILANATNTVALFPGSCAAAFGFRAEVGQSRRWLARLLAPSLLGGIAGAWLLTHTASRTFAIIVPYLILLATLLRAFQGGITRWVLPVGEGPSGAGWWAGVICFQFLVGLYGGYFGAGIGILMFAALGLLGLKDVHQANGVKAVLASAINLIAAIYFSISGLVLWHDMVAMALGGILGGYGASRLSRRMNPAFINRFVIAAGFIVSGIMFFKR